MMNKGDSCDKADIFKYSQRYCYRVDTVIINWDGSGGTAVKALTFV